MMFQFAPAIQAGINHGVYEIVRNTATGELIGIARNKVTGQFVAHAVGMATQATGLAIDPLIVPAQVLMGGMQMVQTHMGFQKTYKMLDALQTSVGVLQSATAVIGIGTVVGAALSAVNLHQTLKLREDVKQLRVEVKDGFIDMKQALKDQGEEVIKRIDQVAKDIKYEHHRTILVQAYGRFIEAMDCLRDAIKSTDSNRRNSDIEAARGMLRNALADYNNLRLFEDTSSAGQLRRRECAWAIHQAVTMTYQMQGAHEVVSDRLSQLQNKIRQDAQGIINCCEFQDELDFLFPELTRIYHHDLAVLKSWQNHIDWMQTLPSDQQQMLASLDVPTTDADSNENSIVVAEPEERSLYENLKQKSHYLSLRDQLQFMVKPDLRQTHESYISQQAAASEYKALAPSNWREIPDLTVANLYWYFKVRYVDKNIFEKVKTIISEKLKTAPQEITLSLPIFENTISGNTSKSSSSFLFASSCLTKGVSLDDVELTMALEEEFDIEIIEEDIKFITTVQQLVNYISQKYTV